MTPKHGLLLFLTSCLSGCGQMYQGYMKRGLSLLLLFFAILAISGFLGMGALAFFLPVVWLYAFFDSYNLRTQITAGTQPPDDFLFGLSDLDSQRMAKLPQPDWLGTDSGGRLDALPDAAQPHRLAERRLGLLALRPALRPAPHGHHGSGDFVGRLVHPRAKKPPAGRYSGLHPAGIRFPAAG